MRRLKASIVLVAVLVAGVATAAFAGGALGGSPSQSSLLETPTGSPSVPATQVPSASPTEVPSVSPTEVPSISPTEVPTLTTPIPTETTAPPSDCPPRRKKGPPPGEANGPKDCRVAATGELMGGGL